ncbi:MAG TPA: zf-TFIIB domain-containing protein [Kofleriaceae bacterium]|nr:zf-TFIIB domain-containing protein [Kofleriaceae bacterium]
MIFACPACDSRYDVSGYAPGQQVRCRCGQVSALPVASTAASMLACPHCGAGTSASASKCEHCGTELLQKACPRCVQRTFVGYKHCPSCGAELDLAAAGDVQTELACPRCDRPLRARLVGDVVIDECASCLGLFLDHVAIRRVIEDRAQARATTLLGALPKQEITTRVPPGQRMYVKCPRCRDVMNRRLFAAGTGVVVDVCRAHGTFFDAGELPAIIAFVQAGGLAEAARKELASERDQLERARNQRQAMPPLTTSYDLSPSTSGGALIDLLFSLID